MPHWLDLGFLACRDPIREHVALEAAKVAEADADPS